MELSNIVNGIGSIGKQNNVNKVVGSNKPFDATNTNNKLNKYNEANQAEPLSIVDIYSQSIGDMTVEDTDAIYASSESFTELYQNESRNMSPEIESKEIKESIDNSWNGGLEFVFEDGKELIDGRDKKYLTEINKQRFKRYDTNDIEIEESVNEVLKETNDHHYHEYYKQKTFGNETVENIDKYSVERFLSDQVEKNLVKKKMKNEMANALSQLGSNNEKMEWLKGCKPDEYVAFDNNQDGEFRENLMINNNAIVIEQMIEIEKQDDLKKVRDDDSFMPNVITELKIDKMHIYNVFENISAKYDPNVDQFYTDIRIDGERAAKEMNKQRRNSFDEEVGNLVLYSSEGLVTGVGLIALGLVGMGAGVVSEVGAGVGISTDGLGIDYRSLQRGDAAGNRGARMVMDVGSSVVKAGVGNKLSIIGGAAASGVRGVGGLAKGAGINQGIKRFEDGLGTLSKRLQGKDNNKATKEEEFQKYVEDVFRPFCRGKGQEENIEVESLYDKTKPTEDVLKKINENDMAGKTEGVRNGI